MRILFVEHCIVAERAAVFTLALTARDAVVDVADQSDEVFSLVSLYDYDVALMPPQLVRPIRAVKFKGAIVALANDDMVETKVAALGAGADDVLTFPVNFDELFARMTAIVRRMRGNAVSVITCGELSINLDQRAVSIRNKPVHVTRREYQMIELLALRQGRLISAEAFLNHMYGGMDEPNRKIIDVFMCKLRRKFKDAGATTRIIDTEWGQGYTIRHPLPAVESPPLAPELAEVA